MVENVVGIGKHVGYQHVLISPQCFKRTFPRGNEVVIV